MTRRNLLVGCVMAMVAGKKSPASTLYPAQRRDEVLSSIKKCTTRRWLDPFLREKSAVYVEDTWAFRKKVNGKNGRLDPLRMNVATQALFDNYPRRKNKALLLAMQINTSPTQLSGRKTSIEACSPLPTPYFLSPCRRVVRLVQTCMPSKSWPSDGGSTGRRYTPTSPSIWRRRRK